MNLVYFSMCTHQKYIYNPYIRSKVLVSCGHCPACQQEKATARANRIRNNVTDGTIALFITLTYDNDCVPYVSRNQLNSSDLDINVYRNKLCRYIYSRVNGLRIHKFDGIRIVDTCYVPFEERCKSDVSKLPKLRGLDTDKIGVIYYPDVQRFFKRLRQILIRNYNYEGNFSFYACGEYGGHTQRPHFHSLIFIPRDDEAKFREAIVKAWPYADNARTEKFIEIARDAASYVASYVNGGSDLPSLFENTFKQKHSSSKNFGVVLDCFSLREVISKINSGDLHYYRKSKFDGRTDVSSVLIPSYVINRYFPRLKGLSRLDALTLSNILREPASVGYVLGDHEQTLNFAGLSVPVSYCSKVDDYIYNFSPSETYRMYVRLENCYQKFHKETGLNRYDYAHYYVAAWDCYKSSVLKDSLTNVEKFEDFSDYYLNVAEYLDEDGFDELDIVCPSLKGLRLTVDPNTLSDVVRHTANYERVFDKCCKQKKVTNFVMDSLNLFV